MSAVVDPKRAPHVLVITATAESGYPNIGIECPGLEEGQCRCYWECIEKDCDPELDDDYISHDVEHIPMSFGWGVESDDCWVKTYDGVRDAVTDAFLDAKVEIVPGRYLIDHDSDSDDCLHLSLVATPGAFPLTVLL